MAVTSEFDFIVQWHLTERCNLRCKHCYQGDTALGELSPGALREALAEVVDALNTWGSLYDIRFMPGFSITGGEPVLSEHFYGVLETLADYGFSTSVLSNGTLITDKHAARMSELGVRVQVSVEGPEKEHDSIRGRGSFKAAMNGVRCLSECGVEVTLNSTLSRDNAGRFLEIADIARASGAARLGFARLVPSGRGADMDNSLLSGKELKGLYERIASCDAKDVVFVSGDPVYSRMKSTETHADLLDIACGGCAAGVSGVTILSDGTMLPCRRFNVPLGNITKDSLREVWADSPVLGRLRDRGEYQGSCGSCEHWAVCRGCRAIAYETSGGDICADDPQCFAA